MRAVAVSIGLAVGLLLAAVGPVVVAQDDTLTSHPIIGAWLVDTSFEGIQQPLGLTTFHADRTMRDSAATEGAGAWRPTGERSADITFVHVQVDEDLRFGTVTVRGSIEVSDDGQSFSGVYSLGISPEMGAVFGAPVGEFGPQPVTGRRITVEPMRPSGPLP